MQTLRVEKYSIKPDNILLGTKGSYGMEKLKFEFSDDWDGLIKAVTFQPPFQRPNESQGVVVVLDGDTCDVPHEMTTTASGFGRIIVQGIKEDKCIVSLFVTAEIKDTLTPASTPAGSPTPSEMEQVLAALNTAESIAQSVRDDADNGVFDGALGAPGAPGTDGVSPTVAVSAITGGHSMTITDAEHPSGQTFNIMDGSQGAPSMGADMFVPANDMDDFFALLNYRDYNNVHIFMYWLGTNNTNFDWDYYDGYSSTGEWTQDYPSSSASPVETRTVQLKFGSLYHFKMIPSSYDVFFVSEIGSLKYELTNADKTEIVNAVLAAMPTAEGGAY